MLFRAEKTEVLTDELQILDKHVEFIRDTCQVADKKVRNLLRTEGPDSDKKIVSDVLLLAKFRLPMIIFMLKTVFAF